MEVGIHRVKSAVWAKRKTDCGTTWTVLQVEGADGEQLELTLFGGGKDIDLVEVDFNDLPF